MRARQEPTNPDVLVVCTANAIRSPFVAHLLHARLAGTGAQGLLIESAGTAARPAQPAETGARDRALARGISLEQHRTRRLEEGMLRAGMTVLCAERAHRRTVLDMRPDLIASVFTIREFARLVAAAGAAATGKGVWQDVTAGAARARFGDRHIAGEVDDLVDPVGRSAEVWHTFERDAVDAVTAIVDGVRAAERASAERRDLVVTAPTRRAYRSALRDLVRSDQA